MASQKRPIKDHGKESDTKSLKGHRVCSSESEFEELFLPGIHARKTIEETVHEPGKLKESLLKKMRK